MKTIYIKGLPTEQSSGNHIPKKDAETNDLNQIFLNDSTDSEFHGFELDLVTIFNTEDNLDEEFYGFDLNLKEIFSSSFDSDKEFFGFDLDLNTISSRQPL